MAAGFELLSIAGYAVLFRTVFARGVSRLGWRASIEIPLAGIAAIRLLAAAGAGGRRGHGLGAAPRRHGSRG